MPVRQVQDNPIYGGMIESMDNGVGIVLDKLKELGLDKNTVIIFTSDNGGVSSGDHYATSNLPFRGGKGRQWEGGIREPYYIKVPGMGNAETSNVPVIGTDFFPTVLELAGIDLLPEEHKDGVSLVPLLKGKNIAERNLFWHYPHYGNQGGEPSAIIRKGDWKLIRYYEDGRNELYNLAKDPSESTDRASENPRLVEILNRKLSEWLEETGAIIPKMDSRYSRERAEETKKAIREKRLPYLETVSYTHLTLPTNREV